MSSKSNAAMVSVLSNTGLTIGKLVVGTMTGSVAIIAEAAHSGLDLVAAIIAFFAVRTSDTPPDEEHPWGHGKIENISGVLEALLIFAAAGWIIWESVHKFMAPAPIDHVGLGFGVMAISAVVNFFISRHLFAVARKTDSEALLADAWHLRVDVWTSVGVMVSLFVIWMFELFLPEVNVRWIDPVSAIGVSLLIIKASWDLTISAGRDLMDSSLAKEDSESIHNYLNTLTLPVTGHHNLRTRKSGSLRFIDLHLTIDSTITFTEAHNISGAVKRGIQKILPNASITIHYEPDDIQHPKQTRS